MKEEEGEELEVGLEEGEKEEWHEEEEEGKHEERRRALGGGGRGRLHMTV